MGYLFHQSPKILDDVFSFVSLTTQGTFIKLDYLVHYVECSNVSTTERNAQKK